MLYVRKQCRATCECNSDAHFAIRGTQPPPVDTPETSIWRDINIFDEVGIPSATFGMPHKSAPDAEERFVDV
jgi:hypothetical protein